LYSVVLEIIDIYHCPQQFEITASLCQRMCSFHFHFHIQNMVFFFPKRW